MALFDIVSGEPVINPEALFVPCFREIWKRDTSEDKTTALQTYLYVYHACDPRSSYSLMSPSERAVETEKDFLTPYGIEVDDEIRATMAKYKEPFLRDAGVRFLEGLEFAIDHITTVLKSPDTYKDTSKIKFSELTTTIEKGSNILSSYYKLRKQVEEGLQEDSKFRGGGEPGMVEEFIEKQ